MDDGVRRHSGMARVSERICAVVLAGGPADDISAMQPGAPNKAFVEIEGVALVGRVLAALRASASVLRIVVVAPESMRSHPALAAADELRPDGIRITDSLRSGLSGLPRDLDTLVVASDLPVLTVVAVDDFAQRVRQLDADVAYGHFRDVADCPRGLIERLQALARSHDLLVTENWHGASANELVRLQLAPFVDIGRLDIDRNPSTLQNCATRRAL